MTRIGPGTTVRWRVDSERRIANGYSTTTRYRVLGIRVVQQDEERPCLLRGDERGHISNSGRDCPHDFCERCEKALAPTYACPKCGTRPDGSG